MTLIYRRNVGSKKKSPINSCALVSSFDSVVEGFLIDGKNLFETPEYQHYQSDPSCLILKDLYDKIENYYFDIEKIKKSLAEEQLLNDQEWIEIQKLAKKALINLKIFKDNINSKNGEQK